MIKRLPVYDARWTASAWLLMLMITLGCARTDTVQVGGAVTWENAPMPHGDIIFVDADPHIPAAAGRVVDGAYAFRCKPGKKRVEVKAYRLSGKKTSAGKPIGEMYIPDRFSTASELTADVTLDGDNKFDFALKP
jgi:hypothetical protein